jgi:riboflavin biosynthesis pyrimidine reductase
MRLLFEDPPARGRLPAPLNDLYAGGLDLPEDAVYANFVTSLDGVAALPGPASSGTLLSGRNPADRFLMGLLRALADAVVIGAGTLRAEPKHMWTPAYVSPGLAGAYAALGRPQPRLVVVSASGDLDPEHRALEAGALVLTTDAGAARLRDRLPTASWLRSLGGKGLEPARMLEAVRAEGYRRVLTEGGPTLLGGLVEARLLEQLFLTLSPVLAGRRSGDGRPGMVAGVELLPGDGRWGRLVSARSHGDHLFLRYAFSLSPSPREELQTSRSGAE